MLVLVHTAAHSVYLPASLPTPHQRVWHLGPVPVRPYALCILVGIGIALWWGARRWRADGGPAGVVPRIALWMVPFAIIGGRIQHVAAHSGRYFSAGSDSWNALKFWHGGLGIWGVLLFAGLGALIGGRRKGIPLFSLADALAPGVAVAQALDRWGNWLNQRPYDHPAAVAGTAWGRSLRTVPHSHLSTFESAFLYESLWCLGAAALVVAVGRSYALERGSAFALLVGTYSLVVAGWNGEVPTRSTTSPLHR